MNIKQYIDKLPFFNKQPDDVIPYDPETQYPVIKSSICTGEKVAGFKGKSDGKFIEVMLIKNDNDKQKFMKLYGLDTVKTEY